MPDIYKAIRALTIERECVSRDCDRNCVSCDLAQDRDWLLSAYDDALEFLKAQKPQVLCYEEVDSPNPESGLWLEDRGHKGDVMLALYNGGVDEDMEFTDSAGIKHYRDSYDYGVLWRCWTAKPTEEQRKAVKWDD